LATHPADKALTTIELTSSKTGQIEIIECRTVFVFIGAVPHTKWLPETIRMLERNLPNQALATGDETAMNSWAEARLSNAKRVVRMTDRITRAATTRVAVAKFFRNALITAIGQVPSLRQKIAMQLAELSLAQSR